jgi:hypothetical protein
MEITQAQGQLIQEHQERLIKDLKPEEESLVNPEIWGLYVGSAHPDYKRPYFVGETKFFQTEEEAIKALQEEKRRFIYAQDPEYFYLYDGNIEDDIEDRIDQWYHEIVQREWADAYMDHKRHEAKIFKVKAGLTVHINDLNDYW